MTLKQRTVTCLIGIIFAVSMGADLTFAQNNLGRSPLTSPRIVNLDGNPGTLKIVAGDEAGNINGFNGTGGLLWQVPLRINGSPTSVQGTPAIADMDNNGLLEIVVSTGNVNFQSTNPGGVILLRLQDAAGLLPPTQRQLLAFQNISVDPPDNVPDSSIVSPALADLNMDGILDIVVGSFDQILRAIDINGTPLWSDLVNEQGIPTLYNGIKTGDTIFSSPVVANIDNDPQPEVILGIEALEARPCQAAVNFTLANAGGGILVIDGKTGQFDTNTPFVRPDNSCGIDRACPLCPAQVRLTATINQLFNSTPAIGDVNGDGILDIVHGTGRFFAGLPSTGPQVFARNTNNGNILWSRTTGGSQVPSSPALGDVNGDGRPDVFVRTEDNRLFGFDGPTGNPLPGFPVNLISAGGTNSFLSSPVMGDVDGDGVPEIAVVAFGNLNIVKSNGTIPSSTPFPNLLNNTPAIGDVDGDGLQEIVVEGTNVQIAQTIGGGSVLPWPQFKANARGTSLFNDTGAPPPTPTPTPISPIVDVADYDGDKKADVGVFTPSNGQWFISGSLFGPFIFGFPFGSADDIPAPGDYDGDGSANLTYFRPSTGEWHVLLPGGEDIQVWGQAGDTPVPGDYDGDKKTDRAIWRGSTGDWFILGSVAGVMLANWGIPGDMPVPADYDGDGKDDIAVFRGGQWFIVNSSGGIQTPALGTAGDVPVPGLYQGPGSANVAVWTPTTGTWKGILRNGRTASKVWGANGDRPVPADFDGDGRADLGIFNTSLGFGQWFILTSSSGYNPALPIITFWGLAGDFPVSGSGGK